MRILGIFGSMRKHRHTDTLVRQVLAEVQRIEPAVVADVIYPADMPVHPCRVVCSSYCSNHPYHCSIADDAADILPRMAEADGLVIGAPLYFRGPPAGFQALIERLISIHFFYETQGTGHEGPPLKGKPCGLVGVAEYSNPHQVLEYLHDFCTGLKMRSVLLDAFPYLGVAGQGDAGEDETFKPFERARDLAIALVDTLRG